MGIVNNDGISVFSDLSISNNIFSISYLNLFRKMDSLNVDSISIAWQVQVFDSLDSITSINGPYSLNIFKDSMNVDIPNLALELGDTLFSRNMHIETKMVYIYNDSLELTMDYSIDQGESWSNEFMIDTSYNNVDFSYSWNILNEFGWNYIENLKIKALCESRRYFK